MFMETKTNKILVDSIVKEYVQMYGLDQLMTERLVAELSLLDTEKLTHAHKKVQEHLAQKELISSSELILA